ncbi:DUF2635 domain-containing protein [Rhizobium mayense]|uniref:DUF2635 domain-containing protein n=1 Tax=Rhizobium mayense TaxID=1312184 RepID=A0ABT7JZR0_9HYPH|nr:DUF2635 domain-containing protein [Rhizobium mayense]MDL2401253.1 DUF2635 domain-containing protein [Rhizobium mayense]
MGKYLKPGPGRTVFQEDGRLWPADGMDAENTLYIRRRLKDGDLIETTAPAAAATPAPAVSTPASTPAVSASSSSGSSPAGATATDTQASDASGDKSKGVK